MSLFGGRKQQPPPPANTFPPSPAAPTRQPVGFETVLGPGSVLKGDLKSLGNVRLDGTFEGTLEIGGNVLVGETARITADVSGKNVSIAGAVRGNVSGKKVQLLRTARVWGDISASAISTEEGAFIDCKIAMLAHEAARGPDTADEPAAEEVDSPAPQAPTPEEPPA